MSKKYSFPIGLDILFKKAAELASQVPEPMQAAAFNRAFNILLGQEEYEVGPKSSPRKTKPKRKSGLDNKGISSEIDSISENLDRTKYPYITSSVKTLERSMCLLKAVRDDLGIDGLTPPQIATVLTNKFRIPTSRTRVSTVLSSAGNLVDRTKKGNAYFYRIMEPGERHLEKFKAEKDQTENSTSKGQTKKRKVSGKQKTSKSSKASGRPGPKAALEDLLNDGYFDKRRRIKEIKTHLESSVGYSYSVQELSPSLLRLVRNEKLAREKDEDKQYGYFRQSS